MVGEIGVGRRFGWKKLTGAVWKVIEKDAGIPDFYRSNLTGAVYLLLFRLTCCMCNCACMSPFITQ